MSRATHNDTNAAIMTAPKRCDEQRTRGRQLATRQTATGHANIQQATAADVTAEATTSRSRRRDRGRCRTGSRGDHIAPQQTRQTATEAARHDIASNSSRPSCRRDNRARYHTMMHNQRQQQQDDAAPSSVPLRTKQMLRPFFYSPCCSRSLPFSLIEHSSSSSSAQLMQQ